MTQTPTPTPPREPQAGLQRPCTTAPRADRHPGLRPGERHHEPPRSETRAGLPGAAPQAPHTLDRDRDRDRRCPAARRRVPSGLHNADAVTKSPQARQRRRASCRLRMQDGLRAVVFGFGLWAAALPGPAGAKPGGVRAARSSAGERLVAPAYQALQRWRFDEARAIATALLSGDAAQAAGPYLDALIGTLKFYSGDYADAVVRLKAARAARLRPRFWQDLERAQAAAQLTQGYAEAHSEHFILRYPPGRDAILAPFALETLEQALKNIGERLGFSPRGRVVVEVYPSASSLAKVSGLSEEEIRRSGTIALSKYNRLMVTSPRAVVFGYAWRDTLAHELAHLIIGSASHNRAPIWLHEGIAKYIETGWRGAEGQGISLRQQQALKEALQQRRLIPFSKLHPSIAKLPNQEASSLAFSEVFSFIQYVVEQEGWTAVRGLLRQLGQGDSLEDAAKRQLGTTLKTAFARWRRWLGKRELVDVAAGQAVKGDRQLRLKQQADTPDDPLFGLNKRGRRFARAADLLYGRGRYRAAQIELQKAAELTDSPLVHAKLAMVALDNGDLATATQAAERALAAQPELAGPNLTLAEVFLRSGEADRADLPLRRAIDINPFDPRIHRLRLQLAKLRSDEALRAAAQAALDQLAGRAPRPPALGLGSAIRVTGAPWARIYLRPEAHRGARIPTGQVCPSGAISLRPGAYELELLPPEGPPQRQSFTIGATPLSGEPHPIQAREENP